MEACLALAKFGTRFIFVMPKKAGFAFVDSVPVC